MRENISDYNDPKIRDNCEGSNERDDNNRS